MQIITAEMQIRTKQMQIGTEMQKRKADMQIRTEMQIRTTGRDANKLYKCKYKCR